MIEFVLKYYESTNGERISEFSKDVARLLNLENLPVSKFENNHFISDEIRKKLTQKEYELVNNLIGSIKLSEHLSNHKTIGKYLSPKKRRLSKKPLFADFFSGAGGLGLGLEQAGFQPSFVTDFNYSALQTYFLNRKLPLDSYFLGDMRDIIQNFNPFHNKGLKDLFLISGGPPCQGFSMANRQPLLKDPRNELYKDFLLVLEEFKPPFFLLENVRGMANKREEIERDFKKILGKEYKYCFLILNAKEYNIPQNRERLFIIGNRIGVNPEDLAFSIKTKARGTKYTLKHALEGLPPIQAGTEFNQPLLENDDIGYKIQKYDQSETLFSKFINSGRKQNYVFNHKSRFNNENDREIFSRLPQGGNSLHESIKDIMKYKNRNDIFKDKYYRLIPDKVSKTITSHMKFDCHMYIHPWQARGLSPREAARIQTFPDDYVFTGRPNEWYQQIGNAVPVKLAEILGKEIIQYWK